MLVQASPSNSQIKSLIRRIFLTTENFHEFYQSHLRLIPTGQAHQFKAFCPFHDNKNTPAFSVNTEKGVWTCFGACASSGGVNEFRVRLSTTLKESTGSVDFGEAVAKFRASLTSQHRRYLQARGISSDTVTKFSLGSTGDKITYPYFKRDGDCIGYKAISACRKKDTFFKIIRDQPHLYNQAAIDNAVSNARTTILLAEGEKDTLVLDQAGYDVVGVSGTHGFKKEYAELFKAFEKVIVVFDNDNAGRAGARRIAQWLGSKCYIFDWKRKEVNDGYDVSDHFLQLRDNFRAVFDRELDSQSLQQQVSVVLSVSERFPDFERYLSNLKGGTLLGFDVPCFPELTRYMRGVRGMIGIGAPPKVGKSTLTVQIASEVARQGFPVLYYDFENGYNRLVLKLLARSTRIHPDLIQLGSEEHGDRIDAGKQTLKQWTRTLYVENDRKLAEDTISSQVEHVKALTGHDRVLIVVDSVQKLPMNLTSRREGIDNWIRFLEGLRDRENAALILISELARSGYEQCGISSWKESGDLEYSFDHMIQLKRKNPDDPKGVELSLNMIASRELEPGEIATYRSIRPYWYFEEVERGFF